MDISKVKAVIKPVSDFMRAKSPELLTALGITGFVTTVVLACKVTPTASDIHRYRKAEREHALSTRLKDASEKEARAYHRQAVISEAKELAVLYSPAAVSGAISISCVLGAHHIQSKRTAAIATAYSLAERTLSTYQEKVLEKLGEEGHKELMQAVSDKLAEEDAPFDDGSSYKKEEDGKCLCYDRVTGRYFRSTPEAIREAESEVNKRLIDEVVVPLSEFYFYLGLPDNSFVCDGLGWDLAKNKLDVYFTSMLDEDKNPCLVVNYNVGIVDRRLFSGGR